MKQGFFISTFLILSSPFIALAECPPGQFCNPITANTFGELVVGIADLVTKVAIPIVVVFLMYAGYLFVSARGNQSQLTKAKETFYWTIIGALIVVGANFFARATVNFAQSLGSESGSEGAPPS